MATREGDKSICVVDGDNIHTDFVVISGRGSWGVGLEGTKGRGEGGWEAEGES